MADQKISALTSYSNPDPVNDVLPIVDTANTTTKKISRNNLLGITSTPVGINDIQTLTQKTLTSPTINGATLSGTLSGTYTIGGTPTFPASVVTLTGSQTLTNKILTSPTINGPTITNASITADAITGFSSANTGTIYGIAVTSAAFAGTAITANSIDASKIKWSATGPNAGIWWEELGRNTLGIAGATITIASFTARKYLRIQISMLPSGATTGNIKFNNDSATNYAYATSTNGAPVATAVSQTSIIVDVDGAALSKFVTLDVINIAAQPKLVNGDINSEGTSGAGTAPNMRILAAKWQNTASQITRVDITNVGGGSFAAGSEVVVLGHD